jgi:acetyl esterase/lipase
MATFEERIDPELVAGLDIYRFLGFESQQLSGDTLTHIRGKLVEMRSMAETMMPANDRVARSDRTVPGPAGAPDVRVRIYRPLTAEGTLPCLVWIHGGGMIMGTIDGDDFACDAYAEAVGCVVVSVDYRLAPEHPYPAPLDDCYAALKWVASAADELGIDAARIAIGGASAGGGLAAGTALLARDRGGPGLVCQVLVYPMLDDRMTTPSSQEFSGILTWSREHNRSGWSHYLGDAIGGPEVPPYAAPARAGDLGGLPPALIQVGALDLFRDEDIDYAQRLLQAGVSTAFEVYPGAYHGFDTLAAESAASQKAVGSRIAALTRALRAPDPNASSPEMPRVGLLPAG